MVAQSQSICLVIYQTKINTRVSKRLGVQLSPRAFITKIKNKSRLKTKMKQTTWFERAIFLGWHCSISDCKFCYMSTQKKRTTKPAYRSIESVIAEVLICNAQGWKVDFITSGYNAMPFERLLKITKIISSIYKDELWINVGTLTREQLQQLLPYISGVNMSFESATPSVMKKVCPSKNFEKMEQMFELCDELNLKKAVTLIIGIGETEQDMPILKKFIEKHNLDRVTLYALNPHKGTPFTKGPDIKYYSSWIKYVSILFPKLILVCGIWKDRTNDVSEILNSGADAITKFPAIKMFNSVEAKEIHKQAEISGRAFKGSLVDKGNINKEARIIKEFLSVEENTILRSRLDQYIRLMRKN